jgi:hypothetical protein
MSWAEENLETWEAYAYLAGKEEAEEKLLKTGKWTTKDGRKINIFVRTECDDKHFDNICKMIARNGFEDWFVEALRAKRARKLKKQTRDLVTLKGA